VRTAGSLVRNSLNIYFYKELLRIRQGNARVKPSVQCLWPQTWEFQQSISGEKVFR